MNLAMAVHRVGAGAVAAAVAFDDWDAPEPSRTYSCQIDQIEKALRGELDLRDLPTCCNCCGCTACNPS